MFIHIILFLRISSICILCYNVILIHDNLFIVMLQRTRQNSEFSMGPANAIMQIFLEANQEKKNGTEKTDGEDFGPTGQALAILLIS